MSDERGWFSRRADDSFGWILGDCVPYELCIVVWLLLGPVILIGLGVAAVVQIVRRKW